jgi:carboxypeptidase D
MVSSCIGQFDYVQEEVPAVPYVVANNNFFNFNDSFIAQLEDMHKSCGYADYIEKYLVFPPSGVQPPVFFNYSSQENCDVFDLIDFAAFDPNPCFGMLPSLYHARPRTIRLML